VNDDNQTSDDEYWDDLFEWFDEECSPERAAAIERRVHSAREVERRVEVERARWMRLKDLAVPAMKTETLVALLSLQRRRDLLEGVDGVRSSPKGSRGVLPIIQMRAAAAGSARGCGRRRDAVDGKEGRLDFDARGAASVGPHTLGSPGPSFA
jgi:hypothetical protein